MQICTTEAMKRNFIPSPVLICTSVSLVLLIDEQYHRLRRHIQMGFQTCTGTRVLQLAETQLRRHIQKHKSAGSAIQSHYSAQELSFLKSDKSHTCNSDSLIIFQIFNRPFFIKNHFLVQVIFAFHSTFRKQKSKI